MSSPNNVIKINLNKEERNWETFVEKCFTACMNRNGTVEESRKKDFVYSFTYAPDEITLTIYKQISDIPYELKSINLGVDAYLSGNKSDKDIIESLFNTIQSDTQF